MERATVEHIEKQINDELSKRMPGAAERVAVLQYGDDPVIEPGEILVRVFVAAGEGEEAQEQAIRSLEQGHGPAIKELRRDITAHLPEVRRLEFVTTSDAGHGPRMVLGKGRRSLADREMSGAELTPVMARLGPADLETLDALITAGIAGSRAEAVRWALARIRERPAYAQLRERAQEIERLKNEF